MKEFIEKIDRLMIENQELKDQLKQFEFQERDKSNGEGGAYELIKSINVNRANFEYIAKTGNINGTLLSELTRVLNEYSTSQIKKKVEEVTSDEIDEYVQLYIESNGYKMHDLATENECLTYYGVNHCVLHFLTQLTK